MTTTPDDRGTLARMSERGICLVCDGDGFTERGECPQCLGEGLGPPYPEDAP